MQSYMHMRCQARQLDSYSSARHCSTARQLDSYSTDLDRPRQTSTKLDAPAHGVSLDRLDKARQGSTGKASTTGSTAPRRSLDSSTARQPGLKAGPHVKSSTFDRLPWRCLVRPAGWSYARVQSRDRPYCFSIYIFSSSTNNNYTSIAIILRLRVTIERCLTIEAGTTRDRCPEAASILSLRKRSI